MAQLLSLYMPIINIAFISFHQFSNVIVYVLC